MGVGLSVLASDSRETTALPARSLFFAVAIFVFLAGADFPLTGVLDDGFAGVLLLVGVFFLATFLAGVFFPVAAL